VTDTFERLKAALADRYAIEREIGAGGMALVYLAEDLKLHRQVAIKVLRPELAVSLGADRFLQEIEVTANLQHPNILQLYEADEADDLLYYVMPYVEGETLHDRLTRDGKLSLDDALKITDDIAAALGYAHEHGIVHRDIKPENILLTGGRAVVADFGIARAVEVAGGERLTGTGLAVGTPAYMSPEQAMAVAEVDHRSDVYSLGCVIYEMIGGHAPFTGHTPRSVIAKHAVDTVPDLHTSDPAIPLYVKRAVEKALAKRPSERFQSVGEFVEVLTLGTVVRAVHRPWRRPVLLGVALAVVVGAALVVGRWIGPTAAGEPEHPRTAIAVLPFQNLSADGPYAYFAGGLHDELLTQLFKVAALSVRGRISVMGYAGPNTPPLRQIASELEVGSVVVASVQVVGDRLRVNVQLIDAATDEHLWTDGYDRTLEDAFAIQSDIAQRIVAAVGLTLTSGERQGIVAVPTTNSEAYQFYLEAREYQSRPGVLKQNLETAEQLYALALARDTAFALAHAGLSRVHGTMYQLRYDPSPARAARQREEAEAALRLAPGLPQAHSAMGYSHYVGGRDYRMALSELMIARDGLPNNAGILATIGVVQRRLGNWNGALAALDRALLLDPRNPGLLPDLAGLTYVMMHRYAEAVEAFDRALSLAPDLHSAAVVKGRVYALWQGRLDTLRAALGRIPGDAKLGAWGSVFAQRAALLHWERQADSMLQTVTASSAPVFEGFHFFLPVSLYAGWAHQLRGDRQAARASFDAALVLLDSVSRERPEDWRLHAARGLTLAGLGLRDEALRETRWIERSQVYREDAVTGPAAAEERARILAQVGEVDAALDEVERLVNGPSWLSTHTLRLDPLWDPIRKHPRFIALLASQPERSPP
jgi:serine/threonine-protein kinase